MTNFIQDGETIEYTNAGSAISAGDVVVIGKLAGIAAVDIAASTGVGTVCLEGVFNVPKNTSTAFTLGAQLFWDGTEVTNDPTDTPLGTAHEAAAEAATTINVKLAAAGDNVPQAAVVAFTAGTNLTGVDGAGSNAAPLVGTETRLDSLDTAVAAILTALKNAGLMASA